MYITVFPNVNILMYENINVKVDFKNKCKINAILLKFKRKTGW